VLHCYPCYHPENNKGLKENLGRKTKKSWAFQSAEITNNMFWFKNKQIAKIVKAVTRL